MTDPLKILIVDDSLIYRKFLSRVIEDIEGVELVAPAANGRIALSRLQVNPVDVVFLDMQLPEMSGLETLRRIREAHPEVGVIMISGEYASDAEVVIRALELGALDFLPKAPLEPEGNSVLALRKHLVTLFHQLQGRKNLHLAKRMSRKQGRHPVQAREAGGLLQSRTPGAECLQKVPAAAPAAAPVRSVHPARIDVVVMGASTGGPNALSAVLPKLPADIGVPILVVQHMPSFLTFSLAQSLNGKSALQVHEAVHGEPLSPGTVYVAPGGKHLLVKSRPAGSGPTRERFLALGEGPPENSVRPSADVLFRSVAESFEGHTLAVLLTGMGNDGMKGVQALKGRGCYCITQTAESCVVYGMPRAVDEAGLSDDRVPLDGMAERIERLVRGSFVGRHP